jgi:hypothetical protein
MNINQLSWLLLCAGGPKLIGTKDWHEDGNQIIVVFNPHPHCSIAITKATACG